MRSGRRKAAKDVKQEEEVSKEVAEAPAPAPASAPAAAPLPPKEEPPPTAGGGGRERDRGRKRAREAEESAPPVICPIALVAGHPSAGAGFNDGHPTAAQFRGPMGIALAPSGHLLVCDSDNRRLRRLVPLVTQTGPPAPPAAPGDENRAGLRGGGDDGVAVVPGAFAKVGTLAGSSRPGTRDGLGRDAEFLDPCGVVVTPAGDAFVIDAAAHTVRRVSAAGEVRTIAGGGKPGFADGAGGAAAFSSPGGIALGPDGTLFIADTGNHRIRAMSQEGAVRTFCGTGTPGHRDGQPQSAQFYYPADLACDAEGTLFVADRANHRIRKITAKGRARLAAAGRLPEFVRPAVRSPEN
uniref:SMP-30/Gluconolactonase/LRE-like region domain-containing protein n=1 Tax=Emiliania huxleyi TaxID=2903 RepID=A0A6V2TDA6_EMIHU